MVRMSDVTSGVLPAAKGAYSRAAVQAAEVLAGWKLLVPSGDLETVPHQSVRWPGPGPGPPLQHGTDRIYSIGYISATDHIYL